MSKINIKLVISFFVGILLVLTATICFIQPKMHKNFRLNIIEYIMKINADGSVSTTKSTTTTVIKEK